MLEHVLEHSTIGLTVTSAAERAGVSPRTAYRYFPTLEAMIDAFNVWLVERGEPHKMAVDLPNLQSWIVDLFAYYERNQRIFSAARASSTEKMMGGQLRSKRKAQQIKSVTALLAPLTVDASPLESKKLAASIHCLLNFDAYQLFTSVWGLGTSEAADAAFTAVEQILSFWRKKKK